MILKNLDKKIKIRRSDLSKRMYPKKSTGYITKCRAIIRSKILKCHIPHLELFPQLVMPFQQKVHGNIR